jgi:hypothetical protein
MRSFIAHACLSPSISGNPARMDMLRDNITNNADRRQRVASAFSGLDHYKEWSQVRASCTPREATMPPKQRRLVFLSKQRWRKHQTATTQLQHTDHKWLTQSKPTFDSPTFRQAAREQ